MNPKILVITLLREGSFLKNILSNFEKQDYENKKFMIITNKEIANKNSDITVNTLQDIDNTKNIFYYLKTLDKNVVNDFDFICVFDSFCNYESSYLSNRVNKLSAEYDLFIDNSIIVYDTSTNSFYMRHNNILGLVNTFIINSKCISKNRDKLNKKILSYGDHITKILYKKDKLTINMNRCVKITDIWKIKKMHENLLEYVLMDVSSNLVSVIITMYNSEKSIAKCINSVLAQTHTNMEIFVVDDASKDMSREIVKKLSVLDNRITLIENDINKGTYYCKNLALQQANKLSKYFVLQDSDDTAHKERIRKQIEILALNNGKMSTCLGFRYGEFRFACISQVFSFQVFEELGYFDVNRFGADTEFLYRFFEFNKLFWTYIPYYKHFRKESTLDNCENIYYNLPCMLYNINLELDEKNITSKYPLGCQERNEYKRKWFKKVSGAKKKELKYSFIKKTGGKFDISQ